jgi:hypothetical protein
LVAVALRGGGERFAALPELMLLLLTLFLRH